MPGCHFYKKEGRKPAGLPEQVPDPEGEARFEEERSVLCKACGHRVTSSSQAVEVEGKHRHTFFNPAGILFEIGCFEMAPGAEVWGEISTLFAWFPGFGWRYVNCAGCHNHIGWLFLSGESSFYGLVLNRLTEEA